MFNRNLELSINQFRESFPDNESCENHLTEQRFRNGFICQKCGYQTYWFLSGRQLFDCKRCRHQTSITAGTIFHRTRVSMDKWYLLIFIMMILGEGVVISEMQRLLGIGCYKTVWLMAHKIRTAMTERDGRIKFTGLVRLNISYFRSKFSMHVRSTTRNKVVLLAVALYRNDNGEDEPGVVQMTIVNDDSIQSIEDFLQNINHGITTEDVSLLLNKLRTDGWRTNIQDSDYPNLRHCKSVLLDSAPADRLRVDSQTDGIAAKLSGGFEPRILKRFAH